MWEDVAYVALRLLGSIDEYPTEDLAQVALNGFRVRLNFHDIGSRNGYSDDPRIPLSVSSLEADAHAARICGTFFRVSLASET